MLTKMNIYQVVVLLFVITMIAAIAFVRGADARANRHMREIQRRKKLIRWPPGHCAPFFYWFG
jgi:hypothetical protein